MHGVGAISSWVEKNLVIHLALDWSIILTIRRLCPIVPKDNISLVPRPLPRFYLAAVEKN